MAFDFGAALSSAGQLYPAYQAGQDIREQRARERQEALDKSRLTNQEIAASKANVTLGQQRQALAERAKSILPFGDPFRKSDGKYYQKAITDKGIEDILLEGYDPIGQQGAELSQRKSTLEKILGRKLTPQEEDSLAGVKVQQIPYSATKPTLKQEADNSWSWIYPPDPTTGQQRSPEKVLGADGKPFIGRTPPASTTTYGTHYFVDADNNVVALPDVRTTVKNQGGAAPSNVQLPHPSGSGGTPPPAGSNLPPSARIVGQGKLSGQERGVLQTDQQLQATLSDVSAALTQAGAAQMNSVTDRTRAAAAWAQYAAGFEPSDPLYGPLIKQVAAISIQGAAPWVRIGRGKYLFETIQQHLPRPTDTPKLMLDKINWLKDNVVPASMESIRPGSSTKQTATPPPSQQQGAWEKTFTNPTTKQKIGLRQGKYYDLATGKEVK